jgi:MYXO-CTERM domain-containing protein
MNPISTVGRIFAAVCVALAVPVTAHASLLWDWRYTGDGVTADGTFVTGNTPDGNGYYQITGITGVRDGSAIVTLEPAGDAIPLNAGYPVDDLITAAGLLTGNGFGYETANGDFANPYDYDGFFEFFADPATQATAEPAIDFHAGIVSEPATAGVMLAGLMGLAAIVWHRRRTADSAEIDDAGSET